MVKHRKGSGLDIKPAIIPNSDSVYPTTEIAWWSVWYKGMFAKGASRAGDVIHLVTAGPGGAPPGELSVLWCMRYILLSEHSMRSLGFIRSAAGHHEVYAIMIMNGNEVVGDDLDGLIPESGVSWLYAAPPAGRVKLSGLGSHDSAKNRRAYNLCARLWV